jgi:hypothetical protein
MSRFDYQASLRLSGEDPPFAALIMAAYRKADSFNGVALALAFPEIIDELQARYDAPAGLLAGESIDLIYGGEQSELVEAEIAEADT